MILGLDQSSHTGWAIGVPGGLPLYGVEHFKPKSDDYGEAYDRLHNWLYKTIIEHRITRVVMEAPIQAGPNPKTLMFTWGLAAIIERCCFWQGVPLSATNNATWFKYWTGGGWKPSKTELALLKIPNESAWRKEQSIRAAAWRGWLTDDHNIADALGIWDHACFSLDPSYRFKRGPEIRRREDAKIKQMRLV